MRLQQLSEALGWWGWTGTLMFTLPFLCVALLGLWGIIPALLCIGVAVRRIKERNEQKEKRS